MRAVENADAYTGEFSSISDDASSSDVIREPSFHLQQQQPRPSNSSRMLESSTSSHRRVARSTRTRTSRHYHAPQQRFVDAELEARSQWPGYNDAGIRAWRSRIPAGCPTIETPSIGPAMSSSYAKPDFPLSRQRPAGPALCTDTTQLARTSLRSSSPISLPSPRASEARADTNYSFSTYSLVSALNERPVPEPTNGRTKTQVRAELPARTNVFDSIARSFRVWGTGNGSSAQKLKHDAPAHIMVKTTTTTVPASPSPSSSSSPPSPVQRSNTTNSNSKNSFSGFTVRASNGSDREETEQQQQPERGRAVFDLRVPLANARSPLAIPTSDLKESISDVSKRGIWIAGREKAETGWVRFGPAYYEKGFRPPDDAADEDGVGERELREFEAWRARGRKAVRR
ncbi:hypothetical protein ACEPAF_758 [Sanghuangporus sanghuang]|uniref:Uncharacterized protein n=1 Tax=Sanghuangporus baumii TaxID=108892 RepID=A0A9Q5HV55_SANBA|nr:hypothetical protein A7U60_g6566 [Sanghuangporus baumii]